MGAAPRPCFRRAAPRRAPGLGARVRVRGAGQRPGSRPRGLTGRGAGVGTRQGIGQGLRERVSALEKEGGAEAEAEAVACARGLIASLGL